MSLFHDVAEAIAARGQGFLDDIAPLFPSHTRAQIHHAIKNAKAFGLISLIGRGETRTRGVGHGIYAPYREQVKPVRSIPASSVFDLGRLALQN